MPAALISQMTPPPGEEAAFDGWYRDEHIPARMILPGFSGAVRGRAVVGEPDHLAVYFLASLAALETPEYVRLKTEPPPLTAHMLENVAAFTRFLGEEIGDSGDAPPGRYLYLVTFGVPEEAQPEFDAWYAEDHVPALLQDPAWLRCRRYAVHSGEPGHVTRAAVHELDDLAALESPERAAARASRWRARLAEHAWFATARYAAYERFETYVAGGTSAAAVAGS